MHSTDRGRLKVAALSREGRSDAPAPSLPAGLPKGAPWLAADARVLFVAPAGARRGFGHLVRCLSFARALGVRPLIAVRGSRRVMETALGLGADVVADATPRVVGRLRPDVVIIDDPVERKARVWIAAARRAGALVVTVHDLGLGCHASDLAIDGSVTGVKRTKQTLSLEGPRFAILDPRLAASGRRRRASTAAPAGPTGLRVVIALGGGPRLRLAGAIADAIVAAEPGAEVRIAGGFMLAPRPASSNVVWIGASRGLASELATASAAVVAGGVTLYEACALGVPSVSVPVVRSQVPTVRAFARRRAVIGMPFGAGPESIADRTLAMLRDRARQQRLARRARTLVDGHGAARAAAAVVALADRAPRPASRREGRPGGGLAEVYPFPRRAGKAEAADRAHTGRAGRR